MNTLAAWVALCLAPGVGGVTLRALMERFDNDVEAILAASEHELQKTPGIGPRIAAAIRAVDVRQTATELAFRQGESIGVLTWDHPLYPPLLRPLRDAPPVLFYRGALQAGDNRTVAIVGTRSPSVPARQLASCMGLELAARGWTVVSGLAWGVDMAAHAGAVQRGRTLAVLGNGVRRLFAPPRNTLASQITQSGALLSEVHPDAAPTPTALVARNRLIAGISRAVVVVEAGLQSGSLYAARFALRQGRALFAVDNGSEGNTALLGLGARALPTQAIDWDRLHATLRAL